jgi:hypothetical protein
MRRGDTSFALVMTSPTGLAGTLQPKDVELRQGQLTFELSE